MSFLFTAPNFLKHQQLAPLKYILSFLFLSIYGITSAQVTVGFQGGEPGDPWGYTSTGASALSISEATQPPNKVTGTTSLVVGGNTAGGNCFATGSGNGPSTPRTFTFNTLDITSSNASTRTLTFKWGNRFPSCNGTGWDSGENLVFRAYHDGVVQAPVTLATGNNNAQFSILTNTYTWSIPPCVNQFYFVISVTTNRADELLFLDNVTVTASQLNGSLTASPISGNTSVCMGAVENYSVTPETGISYTWSGLPAGASFTTTNGTTASSTIGVNWGTTPPGTYTLTVTPSNSCGVIGTPQTIFATIFPAPAPLTISGPTSLCSGQTITLTSSASTGNTWTLSGETTQIISVTAPGTYTVSAPGSCGTLTASHTVTLIPSTPASISADGPTTFCPGSSVTLTSGNATGNNWSTGETTPSITVTASGTYTLTVTDVCGTTTASQQVIILPAPTPVTISGPTSLCSGQTITLTSSASTGNNWTPNGETTPSISVTSPGTYTVSVPQTCGAATASHTITLNPLPNIQSVSTANSTCFGTNDGSLTIHSSDNGLEFSLDGGANWQPANSFTNLAPGTYTPQVRFASTGCSITLSPETLTEPSIPAASASNSGPYCEGTAVSLNGTTTSTGTLAYNWTGPNGFTSTLQNPTDLPSTGTHTYQLIVSVNGCQSAPVSTTVTVNPIPVASVSNTGPYCVGDPIHLSSTVIPGGTIAYFWSGPNSYVSSVQNPTDATQAGTYQLITSLNGCQSSQASTTVVINAIPDALASYVAPFCTGNPLQLNGSTTSTGTVSYSWMGPTGYSSTMQNPSDASTAGTYTLVVTESGCSSTPSSVIVVSEIPAVSASNAGPYCEGTPIQLNGSTPGTGPITYSWTGPNGYSSALQNPADATIGGIYTLTIHVNNCLNTASTLVTVKANPLADFSSTSPCMNDSVVFSSLSSAPLPEIINSWHWDFNDGFTSSEENPKHVFASAGVHQVFLKVTTASNCIADVSKDIEVKAEVDANFYFSPTTISVLDPNIQCVNASSNATGYLWNFGSENAQSTELSPAFTYPAHPGSYSIKLIAYNDEGCRDSIIKLVRVEDELIHYIPNAFTPDGDEFNQVFKPVFTSGFDPQNYTFVIYNRWGELIFESHDAAIGWDGTYQGQMVPEGTYTWNIRVKQFYSDAFESFSGHLTLAR
jgi:gliding motility-associated-like protein